MNFENALEKVENDVKEKQNEKAENEIKNNVYNKDSSEYKQLREDAETIVKEAIRKSYPHFSNRQVNNYFTRVTKGKYNKLQSQKIAEKILTNGCKKKDPKKKFLIHPLDAVTYPAEYYHPIK